MNGVVRAPCEVPMLRKSLREEGAEREEKGPGARGCWNRWRGCIVRLWQRGAVAGADPT